MSARACMMSSRNLAKRFSLLTRNTAKMFVLEDERYSMESVSTVASNGKKTVTFAPDDKLVEVIEIKSRRTLKEESALHQAVELFQKIIEEENMEHADEQAKKQVLAETMRFLRVYEGERNVPRL